MLAIAGLQDVVGYILWQGGLPSDGVVWWWTPWYQILGFWTSSSQLALTLTSVSGVIFLWIYLFQKSPAHVMHE